MTFRMEKLRLERERMRAERTRMELERERHRQERELEQERERLERQQRPQTASYRQFESLYLYMYYDIAVNISGLTP